MSNNIIQFPQNNTIKPPLISEDIYKEQALKMEQSKLTGLPIILMVLLIFSCIETLRQLSQRQSCWESMGIIDG